MMRKSTFWGLLFVLGLFLCGGLAGCGSSDSDAPADNDGDADGENEVLLDGDESEAIESDLSETEDTEAIERPDPAFTYEVVAPQQKATDDTYNEEQMTYVFANTNGSPVAKDIRALRLIGDTLYIGTPAGLYKKAPTDTQPVLVSLLGALSGATAEPAVVGIGQTIESGKLALALEKSVLIFDTATPASSTKLDLPQTTETLIGLHAVAPTTGIAYSIHYVYIFHKGSLSIIFSADFETEGPQTISSAVYDIANSQVLVGSNRGVAILPVQLAKKASRKEYDKYDAAGGKLLDDKVQSLALCGDTLLIGTGLGLNLLKGATASFIKAEPNHLAYGEITAISCLDNTAALLGHKIGATFLKLDGSHLDYYQSQRWLADNAVQNVALAADGTRYVGTKAGLSKIALVSRKLADKAKVFESYVPNFWRMDGFFSSDANLAEPYDAMSARTRLGDKDNDGLWTQMMIGGWCLAYAKTKDENYYKLARKAMDNMLMLIDLPAISFKEKGMKPGYIARSIVRDDEELIFEEKKTQSNWHLVKYNGHDYYWKDDTSSDELTGHWFGFPIFADLCAKTAEEKKVIADHVALMTSYIMDGGYKLIDLDGERTTHGHWDPDTISIAVDGMGTCYKNGHSLDDCASAFGGGGWLNSLQMLGGLLATYHLTKDPIYYDAYEMLITKYRYNEVAVANENTKTIVMNGTKNHSDHELAILAYYTILRYEPNAERRKQWQDSIKFFYQYERPERNPLWAAIYSLGGMTDAAAEDARRTLREMPDDLRGWAIDNSTRKDAVYVGQDRHKGDEIDRVFPYDELRTMWWNGNPYASLEGGDGRGLTAPTAWLMAYYFSLYSGLLQ